MGRDPRAPGGGVGNPPLIILMVLPLSGRPCSERLWGGWVATPHTCRASLAAPLGSGSQTPVKSAVAFRSSRGAGIRSRSSPHEGCPVPRGCKQWAIASSRRGRKGRAWTWASSPLEPEALHHLASSSEEMPGLSCTGTPSLAWCLCPFGKGWMDRRAMLWKLGWLSAGWLARLAF